MFNFDLNKFSEEARKAGRTVAQQVEYMKGFGVDISDVVVEAQAAAKAKVENAQTTIFMKQVLAVSNIWAIPELTCSSGVLIGKVFEIKVEDDGVLSISEAGVKEEVKEQKKARGTRGSQEQSKWKLYIDDIEITGVPAGSEFTTKVENCMNKWNWLLYEVKKARQDDVPPSVFSGRTSLAATAAIYCKNENDGWKAAARDGRLAKRISIDLNKEVRIEEVEKEAA